MRADFPHTALQLVVSSSGASRFLPGRVKREQPSVREESVGPAHVIGMTAAKAWTLFLLAQEGAQPSPHQSVQPFEDRVMGVLEVVEPAAQDRVQTGDDLFEAVAPGPFRLGPDLVPRLREGRLLSLSRLFLRTYRRLPSNL